MPKSEGNGNGHNGHVEGTRFAPTNEVLTELWKAQIVARILSVEEEMQRMKDAFKKDMNAMLESLKGVTEE